jgi:hypothetical protein
MAAVLIFPSGVLRNYSSKSGLCADEMHRPGSAALTFLRLEIAARKWLNSGRVILINFGRKLV